MACNQQSEQASTSSYKLLGALPQQRFDSRRCWPRDARVPRPVQCRKSRASFSDWNDLAFDIMYNLVASYAYAVPFERLLRSRKSTDGRLGDLGHNPFCYRLPVTFASFGDNYLVQIQNNRFNSVSMDLPDYKPGVLKLNENPRNALPYFDTSLFTPNALDMAL